MTKEEADKAWIDHAKKLGVAMGYSEPGEEALKNIAEFRNSLKAEIEKCSLPALGYRKKSAEQVQKEFIINLIDTTLPPK